MIKRLKKLSYYSFFLLVKQQFRTCSKVTKDINQMFSSHPCKSVLPRMMLPNYDPNVDDEAGMKILEDLTENVHQIQQQILEEIMTRNAHTEYLKGFLNGQCEKELFKKKVPVVNYEDIKPYIERIANGDSSNIISAEPITELLTRYNIYKLFLSIWIVYFSNFPYEINFTVFDAALALPVGSQK